MLTEFHAAGSAFDLGHRLGEFGRQAVNAKLRPLPLWRYLASLAGTDKARQMQGLVRTQFPRFWQEIQGLAAGLQLPVEEVFLWNCRGDFTRVASVDGCTTVFGQTAQGTLIAHNEDGLPQLRGDCAIVHARPDEGPAFISFIYPGSIPGHTFAVNEYGVVATVNNLRPAHIPVGLPRQILGRASLEARTLDEALASVSAGPRAGAFHHTFGQAGSSRVISVEASASGVAAIDITSPTGHANHMVNGALMGAEQVVTGSSGARQLRVSQLLGQPGRVFDANAALGILRDEHHRELPIYRCAADDPDDENTLATALFTLTPSAVEWRVHARRATDHPDAEGVVFLAR